tara:strand:- start:244 stop:741 length:498 start_codon:yes stop_codon:yes gene_type:complete
MSRIIRVRENNKKIVSLVIAGILCLFFFAILMPFWFINFLELSGVGHFFQENIMYAIISILIIFYFSIVGVYYYKIDIDSYVLQVTSYRVIFDLFKKKDYVDFPHRMLLEYNFFNRKFSFNKTLMLRIKSNNGKIIIKRFNLSLISKKDIEKISRVLDRVVIKKK